MSINVNCINYQYKYHLPSRNECRVAQKVSVLTNQVNCTHGPSPLSVFYLVWSKYYLNIYIHIMACIKFAKRKIYTK